MFSQDFVDGFGTCLHAIGKKVESELAAYSATATEKTLADIVWDIKDYIDLKEKELKHLQKQINENPDKKPTTLPPIDKEIVNQIDDMLKKLFSEKPIDPKKVPCIKICSHITDPATLESIIKTIEGVKNCNHECLQDNVKCVETKVKIH